MEKKRFSQAKKTVVHLQNNLSLAGIVLKNWITHNSNNAFHKQKESSVPSQNNVISRKKAEFFLISVIVSTSRNESCKIHFCLGEIVFFSINSNLIAPRRNCFSG